MLAERRRRLSSAGILLNISSRSSARFSPGVALRSLLHGGKAFAQQARLGAALVEQGGDDKHPQRDHHKHRNGNQDEHVVSKLKTSNAVEP